MENKGPRKKHRDQNKSKKRKLNNNDYTQDNVSKALDLLKFEFEKESDSKKLKRLENILVKLERFSNGEFDHIDDLDKKELDERNLNEFKNWISDEWTNCRNLREKIEWEGEGYFYSSYTTVPGIDFNKFCTFSESEECWCGTCADNPYSSSFEEYG